MAAQSTNSLFLQLIIGLASTLVSILLSRLFLKANE